MSVQFTIGEATKLPSALEDSLFAELKLHGLPMPERQFKFHPTRQWKFDFAWTDTPRGIAVEIQGGIFARGRGGHNRGAYMEKTYSKINEAVRLGWRVYMFGPKACYVSKRSGQPSKALQFLRGVLQ